MKYFYIDDTNKEQGPLNLRQLKEKGLKRTSKVRCEGMSEWTTAVDVNDLKELFPHPPHVDSPSVTSSLPHVDSVSVSNTNEVALASRGDRFLAYFIDELIIIVMMFIPILGWIAATLYLLLGDALPFLDGKTIGKKVMKIRVVKQDTLASITNDYGTSALRRVSLMIPIFNIVDLFMVFNEDKLRFGDKWAKTMVIKER